MRLNVKTHQHNICHPKYPEKIEMPLPTSAYIHVPFCVRRCGYCDFTLLAGRDDLMGDYLDALEIELQTTDMGWVFDDPVLKTLFIGGGTPTHLPAQQLQRLMTILHQTFNLEDVKEFCVEANPAMFAEDKIQVLADAGVNRISLGMQSFDTEILKTLERDHSREIIHSLVEQLRKQIPNISLDLIFGVPGQSLQLWEETLHEAINLQPKHISTYGLTFEKGTSFWKRKEKGELIATPEELEREMYALAMQILAEAGFAQYEISNFAQTGFESEHNLIYWRGEEYYAFGPGAARYVDGKREMNHRSTLTWLKRIQQNQSPIAETETLTNEERARELIVFGLRLNDGVDRTNFKTKTGFDLDTFAGDAINKHVASGFIEDDGQRICLTEQGRFLADMVVVDFM